MKRIADHLVDPKNPDEPFCLTYGDGLSDVPIDRLIEFHRVQKRLATVTVVQPPGRFGLIEVNGDVVEGYQEKPPGDGGWINGGFFVLSPSVIDRIEGDTTTWEHAPLQSLATDGQLSAYRHRGFWQCMDTLREKNYLESLWETGNPPWLGLR